MSIHDVLEHEAPWALIHSDCLDILSEMPDRSVAHTISDPPYSKDLYSRTRTNNGSNIRKNGKKYRTTDSPAFPSGIAMASDAIGSIDEILEPVAKHVCRVTNRWMIIFHDVEISHVWRANIGDRYIRLGIWVKPDAMPQITGDRPAQGFEAATIGHRPGKKRWNGGGLPAVWTHNTCKGHERPDHPCPKPLDLMLRLVELFTDPGDLVLDPFAGSGTTGVACLRLGRRFIGIEKDEKYASIARERLTAEGQGLSLRDARHGQIGMFTT